jgi:hypothetical protein
MKKILCLASLISFLTLGSFCVAADNGQEGVALPPGDPLAVMMFPDGTGQQKISVAVSQALVAEEWQNLNWDHNVTIATTEQSRVQLKLYAVSGATDVKFHVVMSSEKNIAEDRMRKVALKQVRSLERTIAEKLKMDFKQAKGDSNVDTALPY